MNPPETPSQPPSQPRGIRAAAGWLFSLRSLRVLSFGAALLITLAALYYAVENWRGAHALNVYRAKAEAQGVVLDYAKLVPPPIPDDQNFAATPFFKPLFDFQPGTQHWRDREEAQRVMRFSEAFLEELKPPIDPEVRKLVSKQRQERMNGDWKKARPRDIVAIVLLHNLYTNGFSKTPLQASPRTVDIPKAAQAFLDSTGQFDALFKELREAAKRPGSRFNIRYEEENAASILLPHLAVLKKIARISSYRASAALALNRTDEALADIQLGLRLADSLSSERTLISYLVRIAIVNLLVQPVWEGLAEHRWNESQLAELQRAFSQEKPIPQAAYALNGERGFGNSLIELLKRKPELFASIFTPDETGNTALPQFSIVRWMPTGWLHLEQVEYNRVLDQMTQLAPTETQPPFNPVAYTEENTRLMDSLKAARWPLLQHQFFAKMLLPALSRVHFKATQMEATLSQLKTSCALERAFLATKQYPDNLQALTPNYFSKIPSDIILGGALKYERTSDGRYQLYSLGWNGVDDGGARPQTKDTGSNAPESDGDWVWSYSAKE